MCERFTPKEKQECNGGSGCCVYRRRDTVPSYDKGSHKLRSEANQPNHRNHKPKSPPTES